MFDDDNVRLVGGVYIQGRLFTVVVVVVAAQHRVKQQQQGKDFGMQ